MMKLEIEVPDWKFDIGDVVEIKNEHNDKSIFVKILGGAMDGSWRYELGRFTAIWQDGPRTTGPGEHHDNTDAFYSLVILPNSYTDMANPLVLESGGGLCFNKGELEGRGVLVEQTQKPEKVEKEVDYVALCGAEISMGDDYGDNESTFRCGLAEGHEGMHQETGKLYGKYLYRIEWEGDMLDEVHGHFIAIRDWQTFQQFCERENISYETGDDEDEIDEGTMIWMKGRYIRQFELELENLRMESP